MTESSSDPQSEPLARGALIAVLALGAVGEVFIYLVPVLLGSVVESFELREGTAGLIVALEIAASSAAAIAVATCLSRLPVRTLALAGIALVIAADFASSQVHTVPVFAALRVAAALGAGALFAMAHALAATTPKPEKTFALMGMVVILAATVGFVALTLAIAQWGPQSAFAALAALTALAVPFLFALPVRAPGNRAAASRTLPMSRAAWGLCIGILMLFVAQNAVWVFVERIGAGIGLPLGQISVVMIANGLLALLGPLAAHRLGRRLGYTRPIAVGMVVQIVTVAALVYSFDLMSYGLSLCLLSLSYVFVIPYFRAVMASLDSSGRVAGASTAFVSVGAAVGPGLGGLILNAGGSYSVLGWVSVVLFAVTLAVVLPVASRFDGPRGQAEPLQPDLSRP